MSEVVNFLTRMINRHLSRYGIVIWYDPQSVYRELVDQLPLENTPIFKYDGSFIRLRYELEPYLSRNEKPQLLIYIPLERNQTNFALIEAESSGCYLAPGHPEADKNTSLENLAFQILKGVIPARVDNFVRKVQAGEYGLEDIENTAKKGYVETTGTLSLVFDCSDPVEILYHFLMDEQKDIVLQQKNACKELRNLIKYQLGINPSEIKDYKELRQFLWRMLLINDFLISSSQIEDPPAAMGQIPTIMKSPDQKVCQQIVQFLRERNPARSLYIEWADRVEKELQIGDIELKIDQLRYCQTFRCLEERLFQDAIQQYMEGESPNLEELIIQRLQTFWGSQPPFNVQWEWLLQAVHLKEKTTRILTTLYKRKWNVARLVSAYSEIPDGWFRVDQLFHSLQTGYISLGAAQPRLHDILERIWARIRQLYSNFLRETASVLQEIHWQKEEAEKGWVSQREIFRRFVTPTIKHSTKIAYILVDALRFEMAFKIYKALKGKFQGELLPALAQLPALTPVGMAALLPGAEKNLSLDASARGTFGVNLEQNRLINRKDRVQYFKQVLSSISFFDTHLHRIVQPSKSIREKIQQAQFILITSQEIDQMGETLDSWIAHRIMDGILNDLQRGILQLLHLGVEKIVLTSDHGYLFSEELDPGEKIDSPGGKTIALHRRVWIGKGGIKHPSYIRVTESQVGLSGDLELVFPKGIAAFKTPGGNEVYFHGGISLQELVIPVLIINASREPEKPVAKVQVTIEIEKPQITNRFFTVQLRYEAQELFASPALTVRLLIQSGREVAGRVVTADKGFDNSTGQVELSAGERRIATIHLEKEPPPESVDILAIDAATGAVLAKLQNVRVKFLI